MKAGRRGEGGGGQRSKAKSVFFTQGDGERVAPPDNHFICESSLPDKGLRNGEGGMQLKPDQNTVKDGHVFHAFSFYTGRKKDKSRKPDWRQKQLWMEVRG